MQCNHAATADASFYLDAPTEDERARGVWQVVACRGCDLRIGSATMTAEELAHARKMLAGWAASRGLSGEIVFDV